MTCASGMDRVGVTQRITQHGDRMDLGWAIINVHGYEKICFPTEA
ncbi:hypothetical protein SAMN04488040_0191 [Sulfitobacter marinus]|uniref:Uncharacterized protein n=1 Tax=Sulfitobacter marinus TaxID=394264 RepID=A0A1I6PJ58_9RHOB|nr:hypothetical protein SAMN04488040_0191 [Sulfitobacter marinus]